MPPKKKIITPVLKGQTTLNFNIINKTTKLNLSLDVNNNACTSTSLPSDSSVDISCKDDPCSTFEASSAKDDESLSKSLSQITSIDNSACSNTKKIKTPTHKKDTNPMLYLFQEYRF